MGKLKPIGSEKLTGPDKLKRIIEIARYKETTPSTINETARTEYGLDMADGKNYQIIKERQGYIIKRTISESETEYIEPMKNRKYYSSYSQALKRLNLLAGELNRLNENEEGVSLFGEQKKFVLRTPKPKAPEADVPAAPPAEPPAVPQPDLPPSPVGDEMPDLGGDETGAEMGAEDAGLEGLDDLEAPAPDMEGEPTDKEEKVSFRTIQKLTGKLTQKIRVLDNEEGMTSEDIKYVINMVLSSLDLGSLSEEDKEDILSKFDEESEDMGDEMGAEDMGDEDITSDTEVEDIQADMDIPVEGEMDETEGRGAIFDSIFGESKVDKVLSKYFEYSKKEILESKQIKEQKKRQVIEATKRKMKNVAQLCETTAQRLASQKFLEENRNFVLVGKTNKNNLVFESKDGQVKISPQGYVL